MGPIDGGSMGPIDGGSVGPKGARFGRGSTFAPAPLATATGIAGPDEARAGGAAACDAAAPVAAPAFVSELTALPMLRRWSSSASLLVAKFHWCAVRTVSEARAVAPRSSR